KTKRSRRGRGEGSVFQRADGQWTGSLNLGLKADGRRDRRTVYGSSKDEVIEELDKLKVQARTGTLPDAGRMTVAQFLTRWLETSRNDLGLATYEVREIGVRTHVLPRIGPVLLAKLTALHVESFYADMAAAGVGPSAARGAATSLATALEHAVTLGLIPSNPA